MKKFTHTLLLLVVTNAFVYGQAFITTWKTDNTGTSNDNQITIPTQGTGYNYTVDWGDGTSDPGVSGDITHTYASAGTYEISISGDFPQLSFGNNGDKEKILTVEQWGNIAWTRIEFFGCTNFNVVADDAPNLSSVLSMSDAFRNCSNFNGDIGHWNTSNIVSMRRMFNNTSAFNQNLNDWDVSNVTNMAEMFRGATSFNQNLNNWDVSNVTSMALMFNQATSFNQDIGNWNVGKVTSMSGMFNTATLFNQDISNWDMSMIESANGMFSDAVSFNQDLPNWDLSNAWNLQSMFNQATAFNGDISGWNVSGATTMKSMFYQATEFNQNLNNWDVSNVTDMSLMFFQAISFNGEVSNWDVSSVGNMNGMFFSAQNFDQDLSAWDVSNVFNMSDMLDLSGLSVTNYDKILIGWSQLTLLNSVAFGVDGIEYCLGSTARQSIIDNFSWTITDSGENCVVNIPDANFKAILLANGSINTDGDPSEISYQEAEAFTGTIDVQNLGINDLTGIAAFSNITQLDINRNNLTEVDLSNNTELTHLVAYTNSLTSIDLSKNTKITNLNLNSNNLGTLDLSNQLDLFTLQCQACGLNELDVTNNIDVEFLIINNNNFSDIDVSNNGELHTLNIQNNQLSLLDVSNNTSLQSLSAFGNNISTIDLSSNGSLGFVSVSNNPITQIDVSINDMLTYLAVSNCSITELDVSNNPLLTRLFAINNDLESLNAANGNNINFTDFNITGNASLTCVTVDDVAFAEANFTDVDEVANFSTNCSNVETDILTFDFVEAENIITIDDVDHLVDIIVPISTDLTNLTPNFTLSAGASADPASGIAQDFSNEFIYTVTAENPSVSQEWTVNVQEENAAPTDIALDNNSINESNSVNAVIGSFTSVDQNTNDVHTYSLVSGEGDTDNASFDIAGTDLIALESFDFETKASYSIRVQTTDEDGLSFQKGFEININDLANATQTITITAIDNKFTTDDPFEVEASTDSNLELDYAVSGPATISGTTITLDGTVGTVTVTVSQAGDGDFAAAETTATFEVTEESQPEAQTITFTAIEDQFIEAGSLTLSASASSGLDVNFELVSGAATLEGNVVSFTGLGEVVISASQAGNDDFLAAEPVEQSFEIISVTNVEDELTALQFFPNPVKEFITVRSSTKVNYIEVIGLNGRRMIYEDNTFDKVDVHSLPAGNYILRIVTDKSVITNQIIKQ